MSYREDEQKIENAIAEFPVTFALRAWPNEHFTIVRGDSYVSDGQVFLYVHIIKDDQTLAALAVPCGAWWVVGMWFECVAVMAGHLRAGRVAVGAIGAARHR